LLNQVEKIHVDPQNDVQQFLEKLILLGHPEKKLTVVGLLFPVPQF
jgi:hypothetical protein